MTSSLTSSLPSSLKQLHSHPRTSRATSALVAASLGLLAASACSSTGDDGPEILVEERGTQVAQARAYLERYGYLAVEAKGQGAGANADAAEDATALDARVERALLHFQQRFRLPADGTLNEATQQLMARPRCSVPDVGPGSSGSGSGLYQAFERWPSGSLTYSHASFTPDLPSGAVEAAVATAASRWSSATTGLSLTQVGSGGDIVLGFAAGDHGDGYPFDGPSGVLAHAFFPSGGGDVHFDEDETWTTSGGGFDFEAVAVHELGHSLGLGHSAVAGAVMEPYYSGLRALAADDILGIQELYAIPVGSPPAAPGYVSVASQFCYGYNDVSWPAVSGATSYSLEFSPVSNFAYGAVIYAGSGTGLTIHVDDAVWYLRARACNAGGCSGYSSVAQARYHYGACL